MNLHPARDELEARKIREAIELCGKNRGPHNYIPIEWTSTLNESDNILVKRVTRFLCNVCFKNVNVSTLLSTYSDVSLK